MQGTAYSADYTVVVTRAKAQAARVCRLFDQSGFSVFELPAIFVEQQKLPVELEKGFVGRGLQVYDWIVFTSPNGVRCFRAQLEQAGCSPELPRETAVAVVGPGTARVLQKEFGRGADLMPAKYVSETLAEELQAQGLAEQRVLLVLPAEHDSLLAVALEEAGATVDRCPAYQTRPAAPEAGRISELLSLDPQRLIFTFFSPSAFYGTLALLDGNTALLQHARLVAIGPVTAAAVAKAGYEVFHVADEQTEECLVNGIVGKLNAAGEK